MGVKFSRDDLHAVDPDGDERARVIPVRRGVDCCLIVLSVCMCRCSTHTAHSFYILVGYSSELYSYSIKVLVVRSTAYYMIVPVRRDVVAALEQCHPLRVCHLSDDEVLAIEQRIRARRQRELEAAAASAH